MFTKIKFQKKEGSKLIDNQQCIYKISLKQLRAESLEWIEKDRKLRQKSQQTCEKSQRLRNTSDHQCMRSQYLRKTSQEFIERKHHFKHSDSEIDILNLLNSDPYLSLLMAGQLQSDLAERLEIIQQTQTDVAQRLQRMRQLRSKVDRTLEKVSLLIANRQLDQSTRDTSLEASQKMVLEDVYQLIHQIQSGDWLENQEETASDSL